MRPSDTRLCRRALLVPLNTLLPVGLAFSSAARGDAFIQPQLLERWNIRSNPRELQYHVLSSTFEASWYQCERLRSWEVSTCKSAASHTCCRQQSIMRVTERKVSVVRGLGTPK